MTVAVEFTVFKSVDVDICSYICLARIFWRDQLVQRFFNTDYKNSFFCASLHENILKISKYNFYCKSICSWLAYVNK